MTKEEFLALPVGTVLEGWREDEHEITFEKQPDGTWNRTWFDDEKLFTFSDGRGMSDSQFIDLGLDKDYRIATTNKEEQAA